MGITDAVPIVVKSVFKIVFAGGACAYVFRELEKEKKMDNSTLKQMANASKQIFVPFFIFVRTCEGVTADALIKVEPLPAGVRLRNVPIPDRPSSQLAFVPMVQMAFMLAGYSIGILSAKASGAPDRGRPLMATMCCFSNVVGMPLPLVLSIVAGMPKYSGSVEQASSACLTYMFIANVAGATCTWTCAAPQLLCHLRDQRVRVPSVMLTTAHSSANGATPCLRIAAGSRR